jgi:hypothetical protein
MTEQPLNRVFAADPGSAVRSDVVLLADSSSIARRLTLRDGSAWDESASDQQVHGPTRGPATAPITLLVGAGSRACLRPWGWADVSAWGSTGLVKGNATTVPQDQGPPAGFRAHRLLGGVDRAGRWGRKRDKETGSTSRASAATARPLRGSSSAGGRHAVVHVWIALAVGDFQADACHLMFVGEASRDVRNGICKHWK